jgi:hypothetical protein
MINIKTDKISKNSQLPNQTSIIVDLDMKWDNQRILEASMGVEP